MTAGGLRVGLWAPAVPPSTRGNAISVGRLAARLPSHGIELRVAELHALAEDRARGVFGALDVVHLLHLERAHRALSATGGWQHLGVPLVLTQSGTDLLPYSAPAAPGADGWDALAGEAEPERGGEAANPERADLAPFLRSAAAIVVGGPALRAQLLARWPALDARRVHCVKKGVDLPAQEAPLPASVAAFIDRRALTLVPAHVRPVKGLELALAAWDLARRRLDGRACLIVAGSILDAEYARALGLEGVEGPPDVLRVELPRLAMRALLRAATLVLSTSRVEAVPNSLLEALALGRPVLAPDLPGIRDLADLAVAPDRAQCGGDGPLELYRREDGPAALAERLCARLADRVRLAARGTAARACFGHLADPAWLDAEARALAAIYRAVRL